MDKKYKVIANQFQLEDIGIDFINLSDKTVEYIRSYNSGYIQVSYLNNKYDIPGNWLKEIK